MNRKFFLSSVMLVITMSVLLGCQSNPASPDIGNQPDQLGNQRQDASSHHMNLGQYLIALDTQNLTVEPIPLRSSELHLNLTKIFVNTMGLSIQIEPGESDPPSGLFAVDFTLIHPLPEHQEFSAFDIKGIVMAPGTLAIGSLFFSDINETRVENADGYTRWWNPTEFTEPGIFGYTDGLFTNTTSNVLTATVNPYKYFADILSHSSSMQLVYSEPLTNEMGRGVFTDGSTNTRRYLIQFPMDPGPVIVFGYVIDGSWDIPDPNPPQEVPDDFPIAANQPEAYHVAVAEKVNTLFYDTETDLSGGVLRIQANVHDWQGQFNGDIASEVDAVRAFSPGLFNGGEDVGYDSQTAVKAIYKADLTDIVDPTKPGEELLIIRAGSSGGPSYEQTTAPAPSADISAFQVLPVTVTDPVCAVDSNNSLAEAVEIGLGNQATDILCFTDDEEDWYYFDIPTGSIAEGEINCFMDAMIWGMELFDQFGQYIGPSTQVTVNQHIFDLDKLDLDPGRYYIRVYVVVFTVPGPGTLIYFLETDAMLTDVTPVSPVDITPPWLDLEVKWMAMHENYVFLTGQAGIWVYDISDTTSPLFVSRIPDLVLPEPTFNYPYLYYWEIPTDNPAGLDLVDFTDPNNPVHYEDVLVIPGIIQSITMNSETLYVATDTGGDKKIIFYDITPDPSSPEIITEFIVSGIKERMDLIDPEGSHTALIYSTSGTITAYEVENPYSPVNKGQITLFSGNYTDFAVEGLYILNSWVDTMNKGAISVFSYSNITGLANEGGVYIPGDALYLDAASTTAYVGDGSQGLAVVDFSNPATPVLVTSENTVSDSHYVYADGEVLLNISEHAGFSVYDLTIPLNPIETARVPCLNYPVDGVADGDYAYFIESRNSHGALVTVNISDPSNAWIVMESQLGFNPSSISMDGNKLAVGGASSGDLNIFWLGYYDFPALVADYALAVSITSVLVHGDYCYAALANGSFEIFDLSAIPAVTQLPLVLHPPMLYDLVAGDGYMYGYDGANVKIFDISIPGIPTFTGSYTKPEDIRELAIRHNILYIISTGTLYAENISVGSAPANVDSLVLPWPPNMRHMALDHHFAYLTDINHATNAVSLWPPGSLSIYGEIGSWPGYMNRGLLAHDGALYEMHAIAGLRIYDLY